MLALAFSFPAFATVSVSAPSNGATVSSTVRFSATASTGCSRGVAAMGVYVDNSLRYQVNGRSLNTTLPLSPGRHSVAVQEWDFCGSASKVPLALNVTTKLSGVNVLTPVDGSTVSPSTTYAATATTSCPGGVAAMGVYVNGSLKATQRGASLNTNIALGAGAQNTTVTAWDNCGGAAKTSVNVKVAAGKKLTNIHAVGNWNQWGELAPVYNICTSCSGKVTWSMQQHVKTGSLSGNATRFNLGGTTPFSDVLWSNKLIGQGTTLNMPDSNRTLLPGVKHMIYDTDVYVGNLAVAQDLEFDINIYLNGVGMEWGLQCNHLNGNVWDIWNNVNVHWVHTSIPCTIKDKSWNHVSFQVQREANNDVTYQTLTVNGTTYKINQTVAPFHVPSGWYGMTVNYQMDGDRHQTAYSTMLDNFNVTYW